MVEQLRFVTVVPDIGSKALGKALLKNKSLRELTIDSPEWSKKRAVAFFEQLGQRPGLKVHLYSMDVTESARACSYYSS